MAQKQHLAPFNGAFLLRNCSSFFTSMVTKQLVWHFKLCLEIFLYVSDRHIDDPHADVSHVECVFRGFVGKRVKLGIICPTC